MNTKKTPNRARRQQPQPQRQQRPRRRQVEPARAVAARILMHLEVRPELWVSRALEHELRALPDPRERGLVTELVYGSVRWQRRLDARLRPWVRQGLEKLEPMARAFLRLGAYQIDFLDKIPVPIAISATQDAARFAGFPRLTGIINAVLRKVASAPVTFEGEDALGWVASEAALPLWVTEALAEAGLGELRAEALALRERPKVSLRPTRAKGGAEVALRALREEGIRVRLREDGFIEVEGGEPFRTAGMEAGYFVAQDASGARVLAALREALGGSLEGKRVLDLCAGRGVKATALADEGAVVVAADLSAGKLEELERVAARLGVGGQIAALVAYDGRDPGAAARLAAHGPYDAVVVDAPCSGLGTIRRHPEIVHRVQPEDIESLTALQAELLALGAELVRPGGPVVYAVCSFVPAEGRPPTPAGFEPGHREALSPRYGVDAFQIQVYVPKAQEP